MLDNIILKPITLDNHELSKVIKLAIGNPEPKKIAKVINSYSETNNKLIGAYQHEGLIGVIGWLQTTEQITIRHISVLPEFQKQGLGKIFLEYIKNQYPKCKLVAETDKEALAFYQKCGFTFSAFTSKYNNLRYRCEAKTN